MLLLFLSRYSRWDCKQFTISFDMSRYCWRAGTVRGPAAVCRRCKSSGHPAGKSRWADRLAQSWCGLTQYSARCLVV